MCPCGCGHGSIQDWITPTSAGPPSPKTPGTPPLLLPARPSCRDWGVWEVPRPLGVGWAAEGPPIQVVPDPVDTSRSSHHHSLLWVGSPLCPPIPVPGGCRDRHRAMGTCAGDTPGRLWGHSEGLWVIALGTYSGDRETPGPWGHAGGPQGCALGLRGWAHPGAHWSPPALAVAYTEGPEAETEGKGGKSQEQHSKCCKGAQGWQEGQHHPPGSKPLPSPSSMDNPAGLRSPSLYLCTKDVILPDSGRYSQLKANLCK